jgi:hypothetical protein
VVWDGLRLAHDPSHSFPPISPTLASCQIHTYHILTQILLQPSPAQHGSHPSVNDMKYFIPGGDSLPSMAKYSTVPRTSPTPHQTKNQNQHSTVMAPMEGYTVSLIKPYIWLAGEPVIPQQKASGSLRPIQIRDSEQRKRKHLTKLINLLPQTVYPTAKHIKIRRARGQFPLTASREGDACPSFPSSSYETKTPLSAKQSSYFLPRI